METELLGPLRPQRPDVIDETFDGEAVLVHLRTGCYYALNPAASAIWARFEGGRRAADVAEEVGLPADIVAAFAAELVAEQLLMLADGEAAPGPDVPPPATPLATPELQRFTDMQDLLMLDPVHDIDLDGDGWPVAAAED